MHYRLGVSKEGPLWSLNLPLNRLSLGSAWLTLEARASSGNYLRILSEEADFSRWVVCYTELTVCSGNMSGTWWWLTGEGWWGSLPGSLENRRHFLTLGLYRVGDRVLSESHDLGKAPPLYELLRAQQPQKQLLGTESHMFYELPLLLSPTEPE